MLALSAHPRICNFEIRIMNANLINTCNICASLRICRVATVFCIKWPNLQSTHSSEHKLEWMFASAGEGGGRLRQQWVGVLFSLQVEVESFCFSFDPQYHSFHLSWAFGLHTVSQRNTKSTTSTNGHKWNYSVLWPWDIQKHWFHLVLTMLKVYW